MELTIKERLLISQLYPQQSDIMTMSVVKSITNKIILTEEESKEIGLKSTPRGFTWIPEKAKVKEIDFNELELTVLNDQVAELNKQKKITSELLDLCLKLQKA